MNTIILIFENPIYNYDWNVSKRNIASKWEAMYQNKFIGNMYHMPDGTYQKCVNFNFIENN